MSLEDFFRNTHIPLDSEFLAVQWLDQTEAWLTEVYHIDQSLPLQMNRVGNWSRDAGLNWTNRTRAIRRADLQGIIIKSGFINFVSFFVFSYPSLELFSYFSISLGLPQDILISLFFR
jgi:hypothetical protein